ncbi:hypothetical protein D6D04_03874 [Aureobasidium pullulans]|nr:hypothetical protein D6D04_03874 [Aureobasidium pullulans]
MSDHLAYDYDHSKATTSELIEKLHYLNDKGAIYIPSLQLTRTQRKWKLIAQLELSFWRFWTRISKRNRCKEIETTRRKFKTLADTRKEAETPRQDVGNDEPDAKAIEEWILNMSNRSNDDDEKNRRKEVKETWAVWGLKVAKSRVSYAAMALVPWMILAAQVVAPNGATPSS